MSDRLSTYRRRRDAARTPEPVPPPGPLPAGRDDTFVIQEHHARRLHWDFRLERGGVLVSWAVPKGLPADPATNHLAVHTEDHPLSYAAFEGEIPAGEYGGGRVLLWDSGHYRTETWTEREVKVVLDGRRIRGRYVLFQTRGQDWMVHRMDPPSDPGWQPLPDLVRPMLAVPGPLPADDAAYGYEFKWDGVRAVVYVAGGRARVLGRRDRDVTVSYPELRELAASLGARQLVLDGELVCLDAAGRPSFAALQQRMHVTRPADSRRLAATVPVTYMAFDLLHLDGHPTLELPYRRRRELLEELRLAGQSWATPPSFVGGGADVLAASREQRLEGVVAKRLDAPYLPGRRSPCWVKVKNLLSLDVLVGGFTAGEGRRSGGVGALLVGTPSAGGPPPATSVRAAGAAAGGAAGGSAGWSGLEYLGKVGTGFGDAELDRLAALLAPLASDRSPFRDDVPGPAGTTRWVRPELVGEVAFGEITPDGRLRHPRWRGLRPDLAATDVRPVPDQLGEAGR